MSRRKKFYRVYKGDKLLLNCGNRSVVKQLIGIPNPSTYAESGYKAKGIYRIEEVCEIDGETFDEERYKTVKSVFTPQMFSEWIFMNKRYGKTV